MKPEELVRLAMEKSSEIIREEILATLARLGEECITRIRLRGSEESWIDQTGNLRSSIGYAVFDYGREVIGSAFESVAGPIGNGNAGSASGKAYVAELAQKYADTYALAVVAGMDYASYVEAIENKDVLASTEIWAKERIQKYLEDAVERATARISNYIDSL